MLRRTKIKKEGVTARAKALEIVSRRPHTEHEVSKKLIQGGYDVSEADDAIAYLKELKYLDDEFIAVAMARTLAARRNLGPGRITLKLRGRGVGAGIIEKAMAAVREPCLQQEAARRALMKKFHEKSNFTSDPREKRRASQFLFRMGFDWDIISAVIDSDETGS
jgi:regulatory protein